MLEMFVKQNLVSVDLRHPETTKLFPPSLQHPVFKSVTNSVFTAALSHPVQAQ